MTDQEASLIERLCQAENPRSVNDWRGKDGYYLTACRVSKEDVPRLIDIACRWHDLDWPGDEHGLGIDHDRAELLSVTAWRALADLKAEMAVEPLIDVLRESDDELDDWLSEDLPQVFGKIGEPAIEPLIRLARDTTAEEFVRSIAVGSLRAVVDHHPAMRDRVVDFLTEMMTKAAESDIRLNTTLLVDLVELHAVEAAEPIERAFAGNFIDVGMMGDWETVRRQLGVQGLGLEMPDDPENSIKNLRLRLGMGIFSDRPIFMHGEIDPDAAKAYRERAWNTFSKSPEAKQVIERHGDIGWFTSLLHFGLDYRGETVDEMTVGSIKEFVLDYVPRKVSTEPESAEAIVDELIAFWEYLDRVYELREAKSIVAWLKSDGLAVQLEKDLADPSNYSMAKSIFMQGKMGGYDMSSEADVAEFIAAYNQSLRAETSAAPQQSVPREEPVLRTLPLTREHEKVGRNDPCPCGSGKKFKKCCGRAT